MSARYNNLKARQAELTERVRVLRIMIGRTLPRFTVGVGDLNDTKVDYCLEMPARLVRSALEANMKESMDELSAVDSKLEAVEVFLAKQEG